MRTHGIRLEPRYPHITDLQDEPPAVRKNLRIMAQIFDCENHPYYEVTDSENYPDSEEARVFITRTGVIISNPKDIKPYHHRVLLTYFPHTGDIEISETPVDLNPNPLSDEEIDRAVRDEESQLWNLFHAARLFSEEIDIW